MDKKIIKVALAAYLFTLGGCSTYNTYAPDWAKIGSSGTQVEANVDSLKMSQLGGTHLAGFSSAP